MYSALLVPFQIFLDYQLTDIVYSKVLYMTRVLDCYIAFFPSTCKTAPLGHVIMVPTPLSLMHGGIII